jgi:phenylalanyl-tRNA synthetase alpha chain
MPVMTDLNILESDVLAQVAGAADLQALDAVRVAAVGKTGSISGLLKTLGAMSPDERKTQGAAINALRDKVAEAIAEKKAGLEAAELDARLASETLDLSLPAPHRRKGSVHPTMQTMDEMIAIFAEMGFAVAEGPDIEDDFHNFTALNFPEKHPAREMHDTFFFNTKETANACCCAPTPAPCRCGPWCRKSRRSVSSRRAAPIAWTTTPPTRRCSIRSKAW